MRYWLHVNGKPLPPGAQQLVRSALGDTDEVLCGSCQALLTVDHHVWVNAAGPNQPGQPGGLVTCQLCGTVNDAAWVIRTEAGPTGPSAPPSPPGGPATAATTAG